MGIQDFNELLALSGVHGCEIDEAFSDSICDYAPWAGKEREFIDKYKDCKEEKGKEGECGEVP